MPAQKLFVSLLFLVLFVSPQSLAQSTGEYELGTKYFKEKKYIKAAPHFLNAFRQNKNNVVALYYAGYSYYAGEDKDKAISAFWQIVDKFPGTKQAEMANRYLRSLDPHYRSRLKKTKSKSVSENKPGSSNYFSQSSEKLVRSMITVQKPRGKLPAVTPHFVSSIEKLMVAMPVSVIRFLKENKARITILPSTVESDYRMQNVRPRGYDSGATWKNSLAYCSGKNVYISQYRLDSYTGNYVTTDTDVGTIRHEVGHAIDYCLGYVSQKEKFRHAYRLEAAQVPRNKRNQLRYFLQTDRGGPSETFAELCCARFGGATEQSKIENCNLVEKYFKNSNKILKQYLDSIESQYGK